MYPAVYEKFRKVNRRERFLTQDEANTLLHEIKTRSEQIYNMTLLSLHTGARAKEIFTLTWGLVDFNNDSISIRDSKGGSRHVYMTNAIKDNLISNFFLGGVGSLYNSINA